MWIKVIDTVTSAETVVTDPSEESGMIKSICEAVMMTEDTVQMGCLVAQPIWE